MIRTYIFDVDFIDVEKVFTLHFKIASSSFRSAYSKLKKKVVTEYATRCVTASIHPVYKLECNGLTSLRSIPFSYPFVLIS